MVRVRPEVLLASLTIFFEKTFKKSLTLRTIFSSICIPSGGEPFEYGFYCEWGLVLGCILYVCVRGYSIVILD
jgi:hypothetical protein